jgi:hypothetical protein
VFHGVHRQLHDGTVQLPLRQGAHRSPPSDTPTRRFGSLHRTTLHRPTSNQGDKANQEHPTNDLSASAASLVRMLCLSLLQPTPPAHSM